MKNRILLTFLIWQVLSCKTNPFTGKSTFNMYPNSQVFPSAFQEYSKFLSENKVVKVSASADAVKRVGERIAAAADRWLSANGYPNYLKDYRWEYNLVEDKQMNAWCMPGGKIVVYTGILPVTQNDTGLAVVLGHEVAHALADHGAQRMSTVTVQQGVGLVGNIVLGEDQKKREAFNLAYGVGSTVGVLLPFSRGHENEADAIGIQIMAIAGYNPYEAAELWKRMKEKSGGQTVPEFFSTHPSSDTRITHLTELAPKAAEEAKKFGITKFE